MMVFERLSWRVTFKCPSPASCQKRFLWTHKKVDLALHPVVGLVLQVGDTDMHFFSRVSKQDPYFTVLEEDGTYKRLVELELACENDGVAPSYPAQFDHCCHC